MGWGGGTLWPAAEGCAGRGGFGGRSSPPAACRECRGLCFRCLSSELSAGMEDAVATLHFCMAPFLRPHRGRLVLITFIIGELNKSWWFTWGRILPGREWRFAFGWRPEISGWGRVGCQSLQRRLHERTHLNPGSGGRESDIPELRV